MGQLKFGTETQKDTFEQFALPSDLFMTTDSRRAYWCFVAAAFTDITFDTNSNKLPVRAATTADINLSSMPAAFDGVTLASGGRFLAKNQATGSQNGIYVFNGVGVAATRAKDADADLKVKSMMTVFIEEGTANGGGGYALTTANPIVLDTTALTFTKFTV